MSDSTFSLTGKRAIVTGGKRGIGRAIALAFAKAGADVAICSRTIEDNELQSVAEEIQKLGQRSLALQTDVSRKTDVDNLVRRVADEFGGIDILVNNAGVAFYTPLMDTPQHDWDKVIDINLKGCFFCSQAVGKIMMAQRRGSIINISSSLGMQPLKNSGAYSITKTGINMLTRALALELGSYNIRANAIAPGLIQTEMTRKLWSDKATLRQREAATPLGRIGEVNDIIGVVLLLASDASSYITGQVILVDGGRTI
ncbi:SDR family NAD(P)-dependent oxidoreductase [Chloroflexota bacterium]